MRPHLTVDQRQLALRLKARGWSLRHLAAGMVVAPVACTAMNAELVKNEPPSVPNMYAYRPDSGLTPASTPAARPSGTLSTPSSGLQIWLQMAHL